MKGVPDLVYAVDVRKEETAVHEANLLNIPVIALVDTNCDPRGVDYVIPSNDDAIRAIKLLTSTIANAALEGMEMRKDREDDEDQIASAPQEIPATEMTDEELLGEATLAKLQSGEFDEKLASPEDEATPAKAEAEQAEADSEATDAEAGEGEAEEVEAEAEEAEAVEDSAAEAVAEVDENAEAEAEPDEDAEAEAEPDEDTEAEAESDEDAEAEEEAEAADENEADAEEAEAKEESEESEDE